MTAVTFDSPPAMLEDPMADPALSPFSDLRTFDVHNQKLQT